LKRFLKPSKDEDEENQAKNYSTQELQKKRSVQEQVIRHVLAFDLPRLRLKLEMQTTKMPKVW
jgi:hypothetical protein